MRKREINARLAPRLASSGIGFDNLVKLTIIPPDPAEIPAGGGAWADALGDRRPADLSNETGIPDSYILAILANRRGVSKANMITLGKSFGGKSGRFLV